MESHRQRSPAEQPAQGSDALTLEQVEAVLRRAVQLEQRKHVPDATGLSREELTRIALEAGLSRNLLDRLVGPASAVAARVVDRPPALAKSEIHRVLQEALLEQVDREGTRSIWVPESGARAHLLRAVRHVWTGRKDLRDVEIGCDVRPADATGTRALVSLEARISGRSKYTAGPTVVAGAAAVGTVLLGSIGLAELAQHAAEATQVLLASGATAVIGTTIAAATASASARAWREKVRRIRASLDRLLDRGAGEGR
jgi:hypothetical protein